MRSNLLKRATVTAVGAAMAISVASACGGDTGGRLVTAGPAEDEPVECLQGACLGTFGATVGPASAASATGITPACYPPVLDPVARQYLAAGIVELPGAVMGPARPTCEPDGSSVLDPPELTLVDPEGPADALVVGPANPTVLPL